LHAASFSVPSELNQRSKASFRKMLELDVEAGIPAPEVLRLATWGAAQIAGQGHQLGLVRPGKLADLVLVKGDPSVRISDIRKTELTIKDGVLYRGGRARPGAGHRSVTPVSFVTHAHPCLLGDLPMRGRKIDLHFL
jgi:cytosine/adenosine deaminase-related metal-dependent hydrolase